MIAPSWQERALVSERAVRRALEVLDPLARGPSLTKVAEARVILKAAYTLQKEAAQ